MTRKDFLRSLAAGSVAPVFAKQRPRNLVFILTDDHRFDFIAALGHPWLKTPNLDRLVRDGAVFRNAFVTTSLCSPSRASILTGRYMHAHGVQDNFTALPERLPAFPRLLQQQGYRTAFIGKWHMGDAGLINDPRAGGKGDAPRPGFDRWVSFKGQGEYFDPEMNFDGERSTVKGYMTDILTEESLRFLRENKDRPFLLYLSQKAVHAGFLPAERHKHLYANEPIPYPKSMADTEENTRGKPEWQLKKRRVSRHGLNHLYAGHRTLDSLYRDYCRTLMAVDDSVGRVMDELEQLGHLQDTLIVYMGDNGFLLGEHGLVDKRVMYDPSIRVPLIAHCPALFEGGRQVKELAANIDIAPTFLEAAGARIPPTIQGRSLMPLLAGETVNWRKELLYEYYWDWEAPHSPTVLGVRTDRYSYMEYQGLWDLNELYDMQEDPDQMNNLLADIQITTQPGGWINQIADERRPLVDDLRGRMQKILAETERQT